jgi:hypothetical protein
MRNRNTQLSGDPTPDGTRATDGDPRVPDGAPAWTAEAVGWLPLLLAALLVVVLTAGPAR